MTIRRSHLVWLGTAVALATGLAFVPVQVDPPRAGPPLLALTFDDGPRPAGTEKVLAVLREKGVRATFFIVGRMGLRYPATVKRISEEHHELAVHTFHHRNLTYLSQEEIIRELDGVRRLVRDLTGQDPRLFRPPNGRYNDRVVAVARSLGYRMVLWDYHPHDYGGAPAETLLARLLAEVESRNEGGIILLHNGVPTTIAALPVMIDELRSRGYRFVTVSELLAGRSLRPQVTPRG